MAGAVMSVSTGEGNRTGKWLGGGSPLETEMTGTPSRTARASAARRSLKEAGGKVPARGTRTAYEASGKWARGHEDLKPESHPDLLEVYAAGIWDESHAPYPGRSGSLPEKARVAERWADGESEVSRGHSSRGRTAAKGRTNQAEPVLSIRWSRETQR